MENQKLDPEFKSKFLAALRSGEYSQGRGFLFNGKGFCCLGVAGIVCGVTREAMYEKSYFDSSISDTRMRLPKGLPEILDASHNSRIYSVLANMNDGDRKTFPEIADYIEANL